MSHGKMLFKYGDTEWTRDIDEDISFSETTLSENLIKQAALYQMYAIQYALAESVAEQLDFEVEKAHARAIDKARLAAINASMASSDAKIKVPTDKQLEAIAMVDEEYNDFVRQLHDAKRSMRLIKAAVYALQHKKDSMIALANMKREEIRMFGVSSISASTPPQQPQLELPSSVQPVQPRQSQPEPSKPEQPEPRPQPPTSTKKPWH